MYQFRLNKSAKSKPAPSSEHFSDADAVIWKQPTSAQRVATTPMVVTKQPQATRAHVTRKIAYSPEHIAADYERMERESQGDCRFDDAESQYDPKEIVAFWRQRNEIRHLEHKLCVVNTDADHSNNVVGLSDADDTSDSEFSDDGEEIGPLSPYSVKRPCELRNELLLNSKLGAPHIDVEQVRQQYTTDWNNTVYNQPGFIVSVNVYIVHYCVMMLISRSRLSPC